MDMICGSVRSTPDPNHTQLLIWPSPPRRTLVVGGKDRSLCHMILNMLRKTQEVCGVLYLFRGRSRDTRNRTGVVDVLHKRCVRGVDPFLDQKKFLPPFGFGDGCLDKTQLWDCAWETTMCLLVVLNEPVSEVEQYSCPVQTAHFRMDVVLFYFRSITINFVILSGEINLFDTNIAGKWQGEDPINRCDRTRVGGLEGPF